ncbi:MAG TPA: MBL fold metallo-hydrolase [Acidimicrobiales bacterium]|nr:MBL fold metallo-hydrolase [Acidimicrobiales bacterium]
MSAHASKLVLLGTAGGPLPSTARSGIASAVVVGGRTYLVDCGSGVTRQLRAARLLARLHRVYLTHLHSDHTCDYFNLFLLGWPILQWNPPVRVFGPGPAGGAGSLPPDLPGRPVPLHEPGDPTPGLLELTRAQFHAHAYDINIRMREAGRHDLAALVVPHEIALPEGVGASAPDRVAPDMEPVVVDGDGDVRVTAVLVRHAPVFPAFAYRFDTPDGSVVLSGDTAPCPNLVRLAEGADVLVHEVFDDHDADEEPEADADDDDAWEAARRHHHMVTSHTPLGEVGRVAAEAGVRRLVLTHFIPGDDTLPDEHWTEGVKDFDGDVVVGRDLMELPL